MPLASTKEILSKADKKGYTVAAFNINNMETVIAIVKAAVELISGEIRRTYKEGICIL
jgi:tagatose 1,6-diphosphate aldolase GatY/KbaY